MTTETFTSSVGAFISFDIYVPKILIRYKGIVQIHHSLDNYSKRYTKFANYLANQGFIVVVTDFPGHGTSLYKFEQGYFGYGDPLETLVSDMQRLRNIMSKRYPDLPYYIVGDQFGSLVLRQYMIKYGDFINGAILISTIGRVKKLKLARGLVKTDARIRGGLMHRSKFIRNRLKKRLGKGITKKGENFKLQSPEEIKSYQEDPFTDFEYTNDALLSVIDYIQETGKEENIKKTPKYLPILIISGKYDRLGKFGKGPTWLYEEYKKNEVEDVTLKIYDNLRADILHANNKQMIFHEIATWLEERAI